MADKKISQLPPAAPLTGSELVPIVQAGVTSQATIDDIAARAASVGPAGADGAVGPEGPQGPPGVDGAIGPQGPQGATGPEGPPGADGAAGAAGAAGAEGPAGQQGVPGADGAQGMQGEPGPAGVQGPAGVDGLQGPKGDAGDIGPQGPAGADANVTAHEAATDPHPQYQTQLASGVTLKSVNGESLLGAGNLVIAGGGDVDGNAVKLQIKSLTRAQLEAAATGGTLVDGEPYLITDGTGRLAVGTGANTFAACLMEGEGGASSDVLRKPTCIAPVSGFIVASATPVLVGAAYLSMLSIAQSSAQFQLGTDSGFATPLHDSGEVAATDRYAIPDGVLATSTAYFWRVRHRSELGLWSDWSDLATFTTAADFSSYIATPTPTPTNYGDPFEGGFYAGLIWNELVQSDSSTAIGTGTKTFVVPNMGSAPIVYAGQTLEARSRANPANKMVGVVTGATGTALTLNITSVGGSGTFSDWSIMSRYRVIVAPKSSGETSMALAAANSLNASFGSLSEGRKNTLAMAAAGGAGTYPAAHWVVGKTINGWSDFFIPSRDEQELASRNLKPSTGANDVAVRDAPSAFNSGSLGSYPDVNPNKNGTNLNSYPVGVEYTSSLPGKTLSAAFASGGAEAYAYTNYWSSSAINTGAAWYSEYINGQKTASPAIAITVRAVRRSII